MDPISGSVAEGWSTKVLLCPALRGYLGLSKSVDTFLMLHIPVSTEGSICALQEKPAEIQIAHEEV